MALPEPAPGLVICYSYLWHKERRTGVEEGRKNRPCAIVIMRRDEMGDTSVLVVPITHSKPDDERNAVELPRNVRRRLGLDDEPSWIITDEVNRFIWPGYDLRPISRDRPDQFHYGFLPIEIFNDVRRAVLSNVTSLRTVVR
jgi:uncharacterized protein YifN (PemK superfamily)